MNKQKTNIRRLFYNLSRRYGEDITITIPQSVTPNYQTGAVEKIVKEYFISNVPILPADMIRDFVYDLSFIASNKNFTYGGIFNKGERLILLDINERKITIDEIITITIETIIYSISGWTAYTSNHYALLAKVVESRI